MFCVGWRSGMPIAITTCAETGNQEHGDRQAALQSIAIRIDQIHK